VNIMSRIHASTWVLVGHPTGVSHELNRTVTHFRTTRVRVDRPESSMDFRDVDCAHCDAVLEVCVLSARRTVRRRLLWALLALAGLAAGAYLSYTGIRAMNVDATDPAYDRHASAMAEAGSLFGSGFALAAFAIGLVFAFIDSGIRIANDSAGRGRHQLLRPTRWGPGEVKPLP
jgi:hypothetical protein